MIPYIGIVAPFPLGAMPLRGRTLLGYGKRSRQQTSPSSFLEIITNEIDVRGCEASLLNKADMNILSNEIDIIDLLRDRCEVGGGYDKSVTGARISRLPHSPRP